MTTAISLTAGEIGLLLRESGAQDAPVKPSRLRPTPRGVHASHSQPVCSA